MHIDSFFDGRNFRVDLSSAKEGFWVRSAKNGSEAFAKGGQVRYTSTHLRVRDAKGTVKSRIEKSDVTKRTSHTPTTFSVMVPLRLSGSPC